MKPDKKQITRVAAYGLVLQESQILLCRISNQLPRLAGQWTLPGGGIDFCESPIDAMVREVREETGLIVSDCGLAGVDSKAIETDDAEYHAIRIIYHTTILGGELTNEIAGTTDLCKWWAIEEAGSINLVDLAATGLNMLG
jgi:8-oxo-dGTP diphosphatase